MTKLTIEFVDGRTHELLYSTREAADRAYVIVAEDLSCWPLEVLSAVWLEEVSHA